MSPVAHLWIVPRDCGIREASAAVELARAIYETREKAYGDWDHALPFGALPKYDRELYIKQAESIVRANRPYQGEL